MLQVIFEFQSLWVELTHMDVANASLYDGASALAEAMLMATRVHEGKRILVPGSLHWEHRSVLENYARGIGLELVSIPWDAHTGLLDLDFVEREAKKDAAAVIVEMPDTFGLLDARFPDLKSRMGSAQLIVAADPLSLSLIEPPGAWGADIVVGEGQGFGIPLSYGGPLLGLMACKRESVRQMPGRISGLTRDVEGRRAFCLTLQTREQHIRRSRATSNVCTNHSLMALAFLAYATAKGPHGLRDLATRLAQRSQQLAGALGQVKGLKAPYFSAPHLFDFVVGVEGTDPQAFLDGMAERKVLAGTRLDDPRPGRAPWPFKGYLTSVDEDTTEASISRYARAAATVLGGSP
jgi:glycine dehydrogenase subunit 1